MAKLPENIMDLMNSNAYIDSSDPSHANVVAQVASYFQNKYGNSTTDATGRNVTVRKVWIWHAELDDRVCEECESFSEEIYEDRGLIPDIPHHPNCRCWIEEVYMDDDDKTVPDLRKSNIIHRGMAEEGGYVDDPELIDQPTNAGITQPTLDNYNADHPNFHFPDNVKELTGEQAEQIYGEDYYDERRIGDIDNDRIANAVYDMGVMSNFKNVMKMVQETINEATDNKVSVDGIIGDETINALNNITDDNVDDFMDTLKANRLEYLQGLDTWDKYGNGWSARTNRY